MTDHIAVHINNAAVRQNMDPEHLNYYGTYEKMKEAYHTFVQIMSPS